MFEKTVEIGAPPEEPRVIGTLTNPWLVFFANAHLSLNAVLQEWRDENLNAIGHEAEAGRCAHQPLIRSDTDLRKSKA